MDIDVHVVIDQYARLDGIRMKWVCKLTEKLSLKIKQGILFILIENKLLEAVYLLHAENVKIALKSRMLAVAYIDKGFVTRFRVIFPNTMEGSKVDKIISIIHSFVPIYKVEGITCVKNDAEKGTNTTSNIPRTIETGTLFKEVPLDRLKQLTEFGENDSQKDIISTLILDPKFLQYVIMLNRTLNKSNCEYLLSNSWCFTV